MKHYQITVKGVPYIDARDLTHKNEILQSLDGVVEDVDFREIDTEGKPKFTVLEGGRK